MKDLIPTIHTIVAGLLGAALAVGVAWGKNLFVNQTQTQEIEAIKKQQARMWAKLEELAEKTARHTEWARSIDTRLNSLEGKIDMLIAFHMQKPGGVGNDAA